MVGSYFVLLVWRLLTRRGQCASVYEGFDRRGLQQRQLVSVVVYRVPKDTVGGGQENYTLPANCDRDVRWFFSRWNRTDLFK